MNSVYEGKVIPLRPGQVIPVNSPINAAAGIASNPSDLSIVDSMEIENKILSKENEELYELVKNMLESFEAVVKSTPEDDGNHFLRQGLLRGYTERVGMIIDKGEKTREELKDKQKKMQKLAREMQRGVTVSKAVQEYNQYINSIKNINSIKISGDSK